MIRDILTLLSLLLKVNIKTILAKDDFIKTRVSAVKQKMNIFQRKKSLLDENV